MIALIPVIYASTGEMNSDTSLDSTETSLDAWEVSQMRR